MPTADISIEGSDSLGNYFTASWSNATDQQISTITTFIEDILGKADEDS